MSETDYAKEVELFLEKLRIYLLGLDASLWSILPPETADLPAKDRVERTADQLLFALTRNNQMVGFEDLMIARLWLRTIFARLADGCNEEDQTFASLLAILRLPYMVRTDVLQVLLPSVPLPLTVQEGELPDLFDELSDILPEFIAPKQAHARLNEVRKALSKGSL